VVLVEATPKVMAADQPVIRAYLGT
jgi:hypothetical protein